MLIQLRHDCFTRLRFDATLLIRSESHMRDERPHDERHGVSFELSLESHIRSELLPY